MIKALVIRGFPTSLSHLLPLNGSDYIFWKAFFAGRKKLPEAAGVGENANVFVTSTGSAIKHYAGLRFYRLNEAIFGKAAGIILTPQMFRKWNTTYLSTHADEGIRQARGPATGNTEGVFEEHYNVETYARIRDATLNLRGDHQNNEIYVQTLSKLVNTTLANDLRKERDIQDLLDAQRKLVKTKEDDTSSPLSPYLKREIIRILTKIVPDLWQRSAGDNKLTD